VRSPVVAFLGPEALIVLGAAALLRWDALLAPAAPFLPVFPPLALAVGVALAARFGRGRVGFALLALALADRALLSAPHHVAVFDAIAFLVPVNFAILGALPERGLLTASGLRRAAALAMQVGVVVLLARPEQTEVASALGAHLLPRGLTSWTPVADPALAAFGAAMAVLVASLVRGPDATTRGLLWALVAAFLALSVGVGRPAASLASSTFLFAAGGLALGMSVIEASHAMAYRDALTGLPSRRALNEALHALEGPFTVAMVDIDHFKKFNDTYGHSVGDQVLRMVATALRAVGAGGRTYRYGGEEFAILFPGRDVGGCVPALEDARAAVEATAFTLRAADRPRKRPKKPKRRKNANQVTVTVSVGAAERTPAEAPPDDVLRAADEALYRAKHAGRNRVMAAGRRR
jgi:diguanylate cyclase (GGDEF)-like protein